MRGLTSEDGVVGPVAIDATPLLGPVQGIGRYVRGLVDELSGSPGLRLGLVTTSLRRGTSALPEGTRPAGPQQGWLRSLRVPGPLWQRTVPAGAPWVDLALRPARLFHMTNFVAPRPRSLPYVVTVHDLAYLHLPEHVSPGASRLRRLLPPLLAGAAAVVTISGSTRDDLLAAYPWLSVPVQPVPLGVDPAWSREDPATDRAPDGPGHVVVVGTREPRKNLGTLLRAHRAARAAHPDVPRLLVVGRYGWGEDLDGERADAPGLELLDAVDDARLVQLVRSARALAAPSRREGFSLPVLEAMAAGTPVLASDIPAHRELLRGTGTLLGVDDQDAWSQALTQLPPTGGAAVGPARERAAGFTWARTAAAHRDLWDRLLHDEGR